MKKNINYILIVAISLTSLFTGCTKVTEQVNESGISQSSFYLSATDADNAINACYDALQSSIANLIIIGDGRSDVYEKSLRSSTPEIQLCVGNVNADNSYSSWDALYRLIKQTNSVLKNVPAISDPALEARKERILGEAYFLRALSYFYLVRIWDSVPLILEPYESLNQDFYVKQAKPEDVYAQIESDLKEASARIIDKPFSTTLENKGRVTLGAVRSAMVDFYLWQKKYQQAADIAQNVISSPMPYSLVAGNNYATIFTGKNTSESIFEVQFNYTYLEKAPNSSTLQVNSLSDFYLSVGKVATSSGFWHVQPSTKIMNAYITGDNRAAITFSNTGTNTFWLDPNQNYVNKYQGTLVGAIRYHDSNAIIYRLADVILMRAEALNELNQTASAIILLNQIRTRAGLTATDAASQAEVRLAIENERYKELAFEGKRYFDLKRTGRYAAVTGNTDPNWLRWPILSANIVVNTNLVQNPGY